MTFKHTPRTKKFDDALALLAHEILKTQGFDALDKWLDQQGIQHKSKSDFIESLRDASKAAATHRREDHAATGAANRPNPTTDPALLIADDTERLAAKAEKLGVPAALHNHLMQQVAIDRLESAYNRAGVLEKSHREPHQPPVFAAMKALTPIERDALTARRWEHIGMPLIVADALLGELGETAAHDLLKSLEKAAMWPLG